MDEPIYVDVERLPEYQPSLRARDWVAPVVHALLRGRAYFDGSQLLDVSYRGLDLVERRGQMQFAWSRLEGECALCARTYQAPVLTELATLGISCVLVFLKAEMMITEVTRRGERADYWIGAKEYLIEVAGTAGGDIKDLCEKKAEQLLDNPFGCSGFVCVAAYRTCQARLWFFVKGNTV